MASKPGENNDRPEDQSDEEVRPKPSRADDSPASSADSSPDTHGAPTAPKDDAAAESHDAVDPDKTWVPSQTPTQGDVRAAYADPSAQDGAENKDEADPNKTWVPSQTPTHHDVDMSSDEAQETEPDPFKTFVPSQTPTAAGHNTPQGHHDSDAEQSDENDFDGTVAMDDVPPESDPKDIDSEMGTVVMPRDDSASPTDSALSNTVDGIVETGMENTLIFSKTMGMRGLTEDEYDEWQQDAAARSTMDTVMGPVEEMPEPSDSAAGKRTQIWSKQSGDGLTIRSRPVAGDGQFVKSAGDGKPDYQIVEKLAEGGMGAIYIATQTSLDRQLAIKTLKPLKDREKKNYESQGRMSQVQKQRREMFLSEALVTSNLVHPHIIPIHDLCQTVDGAPFYSMKLVNGTPWNELIAEMPQAENLEVLHKVCDAMAYAHHNGVVNRDLKPENIMLGEFGEVLVLDWGLAVPALKADKKRFASPSASYGAGTPAYMSPELWTGPPESIGTWSDIYLLGAVLFEAITGKAPHTFPEPDSKAGKSGLWAVIDSVVRKNEIRETSATGELMDIALKAMATDPQQRHHTVLEFQNAIKDFQKHEESRHLADRATQTLAAADATGGKGGYQNYQTAAALFDEAHVAWPKNENARVGLRKTRLAYAELAHRKGDFDLGLQIAAQEGGGVFEELTGKLTRARRLRNGLKYATLAAVMVIVVVGAISFKQKQEITRLFGDKQSLEQDKVALVSEKKDLESAKTEAVEERRIAQAETEKAEELTLIAQVDRKKADEAKSAALVAQMEATKEKAVAEMATDRAKDAEAEAEKKRVAAFSLLADAESSLKKIAIQVDQAEVELRNASIASLIRSADYAAALQHIEDLLDALENDDALAKLPENEKKLRIIELNARQRQLLKRAHPTKAPVQTQVISPSGKTIVWGDSEGGLRVFRLDDASDTLPDAPIARFSTEDAVSVVRISDDDDLIVAAAGTTVHLFRLSDKDHETFERHDKDVTTVELADGFVLSADKGGSIRAWDLDTSQERWSIRSSSSIRDLAILPGAGCFLYAGSRGGESSDVLAYQLPPESSPMDRPVRLGQLRFPRNRNYPPNRIAVSPDERLLLISNSRNGEVLMLPLRSDAEKSERDRFPFVHAADLPADDTTGWVYGRHYRPVNDIEFSADGNRVVTASEDRTVGVWELSRLEDSEPLTARMTLLHRLKGHGARVNAAGFLDPAGARVLSASADRYCRIWNVSEYEDERGAIEKQFGVPTASTQRPVSPNRNLSSHFHRGGDGRHRPDNGALSRTAGGFHGVTDRRTERPPSARYILTAGEPRHEFIQNHRDDDSPDYVILNAEGSVQRGALKSVVLSQDGTRAVTGASDGTAVIWDTTTGRAVTGASSRSRFQVQSPSFEEGHEFNVARLRFLPPDGKVLLTTGFDGNLCLWNADFRKSGVGVQEVKIPGLGLVNALATSLDGQLIVTSAATDDDSHVGHAVVWRTKDLLETSSPKPIATLTGFHRGEVSAIAVSPDSTRIVTGARDGRVGVWSAASGHLIAGDRIHVKNTIVSHLEWVNNDHVLSAGFDGRLLIIEAESDHAPQQTTATESENGASRLQVIASFEHDRIPIERVGFSPDRDRFVTVSVRTDKAKKTTSYELQLWDVGSIKPARSIQPATVQKRPSQRIATVNWSADGQRLAAVVDGNLQIFSTETWRVQKVLEAPGLGISDAVFAPQTLPLPPTDGGVPTAQDSPADVIATFDGTAAHLWDLNNKAHLADFRPLFAVQSTALSDDSDHPLLLTGDRAVRIFQADIDSPKYGHTLSKISDPHRGVVTSLSFANGNRFFASGGADGSAALWEWNSDTHESRLVRWLRTKGAAIVHLAWSPDATNILLVCADGHVSVVSSDDSEQKLMDIKVAAAGPLQLECGDYSRDGRSIAVGGQLTDSGESIGWVYTINKDNPTQPHLHCTINGHDAGGIRSLAFLPDSPYVVTGGADGATIVWNWQPQRAQTDRLQAYEAYQFLVDGDVNPHQAPINSLAVSETGNIATASDDGTAIVWKNPFTEIFP
ncbi:MAG: protein kinase [Fuerstiella sp.]